MTGDIGEILAHFFENPEDQRPDVKELARLLRMEDEPLPAGFRSALAEVLVPGFPANWRAIGLSNFLYRPPRQSPTQT